MVNLIIIAMLFSIAFFILKIYQHRDMKNNAKAKLPKNTITDVVCSVRASIGMSIIAGGVSIGLAFVWVFWGIGLSGNRKAPPDWEIMGALTFWPAELVLPSHYINELGKSFSGWLPYLIINAITWSILAFILHRIYHKYIKFRIKKKT